MLADRLAQACNRVFEVGRLLVEELRLMRTQFAVPADRLRAKLAAQDPQTSKSGPDDITTLRRTDADRSLEPVDTSAQLSGLLLCDAVTVELREQLPHLSHQRATHCRCESRNANDAAS